MMVAGDEQALASVAQFGSDAELACHTEHQALNAFVGVVQRLASGMDGVAACANQCDVVSQRVCEHQEAQPVSRIPCCC